MASSVLALLRNLLLVLVFMHFAHFATQYATAARGDDGMEK